MSVATHLRRSLTAMVMATAVTGFMTQPSGAASVVVEDDVSFHTRDQHLFNPSDAAVAERDIGFRVLDEHNTELKQGEIRNVPAEVPVETLQTVWDTALQKCLSTCYDTLQGSICPTQSECIDGAIHRCLVPNPFGGCLTEFNKDLGPGIGPRPTQGTTRPFDVGMVLTAKTDLELGMDGLLRLDPGSVDIDVGATVSVEASSAEAVPGELVTLRTSRVITDPYVMVTRPPNLDISLTLVANASAQLKTTYAGVNYDDGSQLRGQTVLVGIDTSHSPLAAAFPGETLGLNLSPAGIQVRALGEPLTLLTDGIYEYDLRYPKTVPPGVPQFNILEMLALTPELATPAPPGFDCGMCDPPARNQREFDSSITNTTPIGTRTLLGGITDGSHLTLPFVNDGLEDADFARIDLDADVISVAADAPLGVNISGPPMSKKIGFPRLWTVEGNILDLDVASFLSYVQRFNFDPNLEVELAFSKPVEVRATSETDFQTTTVKTVRAGESVEFRQPEGGVTITPRYTLVHNRFTNDSRMKVTAALQETWFQLKLGGVIPSAASAAFGMPTNVALLQLTPQLHEPWDVWSTNAEPFALGGFTPVAGTPLTVAATSSGGGGAGGGGGGGGNSGGGGSSGGGHSGGGALDTLSLVALMLAAYFAIRRRVGERR